MSRSSYERHAPFRQLDLANADSRSPLPPGIHDSAAAQEPATGPQRTHKTKRVQGLETGHIVSELLKVYIGFDNTDQY